MHERRFSRSRRTHNRYEFTIFNGEGNASKRFKRHITCAVDFFDVANFYHAGDVDIGYQPPIMRTLPPPPPVVLPLPLAPAALKIDGAVLVVGAVEPLTVRTTI